MGTKLKLTPRIADKIVEALAKGYPRCTAAALVRIAPSTINLWLGKGEMGDPVYLDFYERVIEAEALALALLVDIVIAEAKITPKFALRVLAARSPADWARHDNVTVHQGNAGALDGTGASEELAKRILRMVNAQRELESGPIEEAEIVSE